MSKLRWILPILLVGLVMTGCRQQTQSAADANLDIALRLDPESPVVGQATLIVTVKDPSGNPVNDAKVSARGDMNHAGMVPVIKDAESSKDGEYTIPFEWTMAGDWTVEVTVEQADGTKVSKTFDESVAVNPEATETMNMDMSAEATETMNMDMTAEATETMDMGAEATETMNMEVTAEATEVMDMSSSDSMAAATPTPESSESSG